MSLSHASHQYCKDVLFSHHLGQIQNANLHNTVRQQEVRAKHQTKMCSELACYQLFVVADPI